MASKNFIASATSDNKGAFRAQAQRAGQSTQAFAQAHQNDPGVTGRRARLALTLMKLSKRRGSASRKSPAAARRQAITARLKSK